MYVIMFVLLIFEFKWYSVIFLTYMMLPMFYM